MTAHFRGFHGTAASHVGSIKRGGIRASANSDDWLGTGTYFFIEGIADPRESAFEWARCKLWDKNVQRFVEPKIAIVEVEIAVAEDSLFDLRDPQNARYFHEARREWLKAQVPPRSTTRPRPTPEEETFDTELLDAFKREHQIAVIVEDFHIQFSIRERHFRMDSRIPNVSMLCLSHPQLPWATTTIRSIDIEPHRSLLEEPVDP